jgi:hypothetical protein
MAPGKQRSGADQSRSADGEQLDAQWHREAAEKLAAAR